MNELEQHIQAQAQNKQEMEVEHMIVKELILGHEKYEKLDNSNGQKVPKVELLLKHNS